MKRLLYTALLALPILALSQFHAVSEDAEWKGVIAYYNPETTTGEDWNWLSADIRAGCEAGGGYFKFAEQGQDSVVTVGPAERAQTIHMSRYYQDPDQGWILVDGGGYRQLLDYDIANVEQAIEFCQAAGVQESD